MFERILRCYEEELDKAKIVLADLDKSSDEVKSAQENWISLSMRWLSTKVHCTRKEDFTYKDNAITGFSDSEAKFNSTRI